MKKILKILLVVSIFFFGYNVYALDLGKTEEVTFPISYKNRAHGSSDYIVFYSYRDVYLYSPESNSFKKLGDTDSQINTMYIRNNIAYAWYGSSANSYVLSIDIATGTVKNIVNINRTGVLGGSFVVDLQGNYYFADNKIIDVYNNKGEKIKSIEATKKIGSLNDFTPNDEYLLVDLSITGFCYDEGALKLENKELKSGEVYSSNYRTPLWKFASDKKTAVNQYGEIGLFDFNNLSDPYILKLSAVTGVKGYGIPIFYETSSMYYIPSSSGSLIGVSKSNYKKTEKIVVRENSYIAGLKYANNSLYVLSLDGSKYYITRVDLSKKITSKNVVFKNHTTLSHTKAQITSKYKEAKAKGNYTNSAYYKTAPVLTAPYNEGELKSELQTDTLNQLNYYRWLAGLNSVTINTARQSRNQKCAATMAINKELTHYPAKPEGMADDFYKEATAGCGAGYSTNEKYSGNVSYGQRIDYSVGGFVTDNYNVTPNVGHRNSLLDPTAKQVSFGYVSPYASISMYYDDTNPNSDEFFPWPAAGYFPVESISQTNDARWSVWLDSKYKRQKETKVTLTYNNKKYVIGTTYFDSHYNVLYYNVPEELLNEIVGTRSTIYDGTKVHVNISNLTGGDIDTYEIDYDINFFNAEVIDLDSIELGFFAVGSSMGTSIMPNKTVTIKKGTTYNLSTYLSPYNATVGQFTYKIADTTVVTYDSTNKQIVPKKGGKTTLTVTDSKSKKSFTYNIKVYEKPNKVYFKDSKVTLAVGQKYTLSPIVEPSTATIDNPYYSSSDYNVAYISGGQVVANKVGTATITYKDSYHSDAPTATITVVVTDKKVDVAATGVKLNKTSLSLEKGKNTTLTATVTPSNATNKTVTWTSSNTKVATVTNGKVTAVGVGTTTITVKTNNGKTATCKVTVTQASVPATGVKLSKTSISLKIGNSETLTATVTPSNTTNKTVAWISSNTKVATVNNGKVVGVVGGTATITVKTSNGKIATCKVTVVEGWTVINGKTYYYENGKVWKGFKKIDGKIYYLGRGSGALQKNQWYDYDNKYTYYFDKDGVVATGKKTIDGKTYYFENDGKLHKGFKTIDGKLYYFGRGSGALQKSKWYNYDNKYTYYFDKDGVVATGKKTIDGKTYYFESDGKLYKGFKKIDGKLYYFGRGSGALQKNKWYDYDNKYTYYFDKNGVVATGKKTIDGKTYYFENDGKLHKGFKTIDGKLYYFGRGSGALQKNKWYNYDNKYTYYFDKEGVVATGLKEIDGKTYYFESDGKLSKK